MSMPLNYPSTPTRRRSAEVLTRVVVCITLIAGAISHRPASAVELEALWTGAGGDSSYSNAANWDLGVVPINDATNTYNVTIPNSTSVLFDVDGIHDVTDLTLGTGSTLMIAPGEQINVLDDARISGLITTAAGTFNAPGVGAQLLNNQARLVTTGTGQIILGALSYSSTLNDHRANRTLLSSDGAGSLLDLSEALTLTAAFYGRYNTHYFDITASNQGVIDLSKVGTITGAGDDDWLRLTVESGGNIALPALTSTTGRTQFIVDVDNFALPLLETAANTYFRVKTTRALDLPEVLSLGGSGTGIYLEDGASLSAAKLGTMTGSASITVNNGASLTAPVLQSIDGTSISISTGGTLDTPSLTTLTNSSLTLDVDQTFNYGVITDVTGSELHVRGGRTLSLTGVQSYTNTLNDYRSNLTLLSADGAGSRLDLSSAVSFASASYGNYTNNLYDVVAGNGGVVDLSGVESITGATDNEWLRLIVQTGGDIPLTNLGSVSGRTQFVVDVDSYTLPALASAANTYFNVQAGRLLDLPQLVTMTGGGSTIALGEGANLTANMLTSISGSGSIAVGNLATLTAGEVLSINNMALSIGADGTFDTPKLQSLTNSSLTLGADQTFNHGVITDVTGSELHVRGGKILSLTGVQSYTNTLSDYRSSLTLLSADGAGSRLDLSSATSFSSASYGYYSNNLYDVVAGNGGVVDLSGVESITGATDNEWLRLIVQTGGDIPLTNLGSVTGRTQFVVDVDNYTLPALGSAANTYFNVKAGRSLNLPQLVTMVGGGSTLTVGNAATIAAGELLSVDSTAVSIGADGTLDTPKLQSFTNSTLTLGADQTFNHGVITDVDYSELHVRGGKTLSLTGVQSYTNTLSDHRSSVTLLSADGAGSRLDLSSATSFTSASYGYYGDNVYDVVAGNGGVVDLSSVSSITGATDNDWLRMVVQTDGDIPLTNLGSVSGRTQFVVDVDNYTLPVLAAAANTYFNVKATRTLNLPQLVTMSGGGSTIAVGNTATISAGELLSIDSTAVSIGAGGTLDVPKLQSFTRSTLTLGADQTFNHGVIGDVDYSELHVRGGKTLSLTGVQSYTNTLGDHRSSVTLLSADGVGSRLDMSSAVSFTSASYGYYSNNNYDVVVGNDAVIDLSSVESIQGALDNDWVRFRIDSGGEIKLPSLRSATGRVQFIVGSDGKLSLGDMAITETTQLNLNHQNAHVTVGGSLYLDGASQLSMTSGSTMEIAGALYHAYTDPAKFATDSAILHFNGSGIQFLEVGGADLGVGGSASGNFGIGRLVVGQEGQPTTVLPLDLFDSGNRNGSVREALYLYGVGGLDGLELAEGSTLVLDGINVYSYDVELDQMVHLNSLIPAGATKVRFARGYIAVPEPSSVALLVTALLAGVLYHRRRRR